MGLVCRASFLRAEVIAAMRLASWGRSRSTEWPLSPAWPLDSPPTLCFSPAVCLQSVWVVPGSQARGMVSRVLRPMLPL